MAYNDTLATLRNEKGKTMKEVAEAIGVTKSAIAMYESGKRIPRDEIKIKLANFYKKSVSSIFFAK